MVKGKARAAGSFLGGIANNPGIVIIGLVLGGLFLFREPITKAFGDFGKSISEGFGNIDIQLPSFDFKFPEITFPEFKFPEITLPSFDFLGDIFKKDDTSIIAGQDVTVPGGTVTIPPDTTVQPDGTVTSSTPPTIVLDDPITFQEKFFAETRAGVFDTLFETLGLDPGLAQKIVSQATDISDLSKILNLANKGFFTDDFMDFDFLDFNGTTEAAPTNTFLQGDGMKPVVQPVTPIQPVVSNLPSGFELFVTPGSNVPGGAIFETPIANLSLSQIIDKFMVTASQAANILAIAKDDFGDFDFGTNTGLGIGSFVPSGLGGNVSDPQFQGLSATEIANLLTGGNIQNF